MVVGNGQFWMNAPASVEPLRARGVPLMAAALCFAFGVVIERNDPPALVTVAATLLLCILAAAAFARTRRVVLVPALSLFVALGCWCAAMQPPVPAQRELRGFTDGLSRTVRGTVIRVRTLPPLVADNGVPQTPLEPWLQEPGAWEPDAAPPTQSVDVAISAVEFLTPDVSTLQPVQGVVRVLLSGGPLALQCGDEVDVALRLRTPEVYRDPGAFSYADELLREGVGATANAKAERVRLLADDASVATPTWHCRLYAVQTWASHRLDAFVATAANRRLPAAMRLSAEDAVLLHAMLFGDRTGLTPAVRDAFSRTGTFHLFVVSGLHVALLTGGLFWLLRRCRLPVGVAVLLTIMLATAYTLLCGFGVPAQRALLMTSVYLVARWLDRKAMPLNALGAAALAVLVLSPRAVFEAAFQMTFLVIVSVAGIALPVLQRGVRPWQRALEQLDVVAVDAHLHPRYAAFRVRVRMACELAEVPLGRWLQRLPVWGLEACFWLADGLVMTAAAELCMALPMAVYFHRATAAAMPLNLFNIPLLSVLLCAAVVTFVASLVSAWVAMIPAAIAALVLHTMRSSIALGLLAVGRLHAVLGGLADLRMPAPRPWAIAVACGCIVVSCVALRARRRWLVGTGVMAALLIPLAVFVPAAPLLHAGLLEVTAIDVGQGDSLLVVSPDGSTMLVDAGGPVGRGSGVTASGWDVGEEVVAPYLWSRQIRRLDAVVISHAHSDHVGGMPAVLRDFRPRALWLSIAPGDSPGLQALFVEAAELHIPVLQWRAGEALPFGGMAVTALSPEVSYTNPSAPVNDDSLVLRLDYGQASALLEGDAETPSEINMLTHQRLAPVTLLKVGHHGSKTSTNAFFLNAVAPKEAVISVGRRNTFGHPRDEVLARLEAARVRTYRTDRAGATTFLLSKDGGIVEASDAESTASH